MDDQPAWVRREGERGHTVPRARLVADWSPRGKAGVVDLSSGSSSDVGLLLFCRPDREGEHMETAPVRGHCHHHGQGF